MQKRRIDQAVSENFFKLGRKFSLVKKGKIQKLKAGILIAFALGAVISIVWGFSSNRYSISDASKNTCLKEGEALQDMTKSPSDPVNINRPKVCCKGLTLVYPKNISNGTFEINKTGVSATCQKIENNQTGLYPKGSYAMWEPNKPIPSEIINNPGVVGILASVNWNDIEKVKNVYDWSVINDKISQAEKAGLKIALKIIDSPAASPNWIKNDSQVEKITVIGTNENQTGRFNKKITLPVFWDQAFHQQRKELIQEAGKKYANNKNVIAVMSSFANFYTCEWYIPTEMLESSKYSTEKMFQIGKEIIDITATAFPNQALKLPIEPRDLNLVQKTIDYAYAKYPNRFFAQTNGLSTVIPSANSPEVSNAKVDGKNGAYFILKLLKQHSPQIGLQMLSAASLCKKGEICRQDKASKCQLNDHKCILTESVNIGLSYNPHYIEYWKEDAMNSELQSIFQYANNGMK